MGFLGAFSASFLAAVRWWPLMALVLTLPILVARLASRNRTTWSYLAVSYCVVLYLLGLGFFTLYPMPDDPVSFCAKYRVSLQPIPFHWVADVLGPNRVSAAFQLLANVVFFVPLGAFWWALLRGRLGGAALAGLGASLLIETAQLTGIFGYYPCSFRLFDVDDLVVNTLGAVFGFLVTRFLSIDVDAARFSAPPVAPTWSNRLLSWTIDLMLVSVATAATHSLLYQLSGPLRGQLFVIALTVWTVLLLAVFPRWFRASPGDLLVGLQKGL